MERTLTATFIPKNKRLIPTMVRYFLYHNKIHFSIYSSDFVNGESQKRGTPRTVQRSRMSRGTLFPLLDFSTLNIFGEELCSLITKKKYKN